MKFENSSNTQNDSSHRDSYTPSESTDQENLFLLFINQSKSSEATPSFASNRSKIYASSTTLHTARWISHHPKDTLGIPQYGPRRRFYLDFVMSRVRIPRPITRRRVQRACRCPGVLKIEFRGVTVMNFHNLVFNFS